MLDFKKVKWHADLSNNPDDEDLGDFREVEAHYKVMAHVALALNYGQNWFKNNCPSL